MSTTAPIGPTVIGGVDTHADTHHVAVLDGVGKLLDTREFTADPRGYAAVLAWLTGHGTPSLVGVEGTGCYGAGLTRHLREHGVPVLEVNRPDRRQRATHGKSDPLDAENAARRALAGQDTATPKDTRTAIEAVRALTVARTGAVKARTAALNQLKDLITAPPNPCAPPCAPRPCVKSPPKAPGCAPTRRGCTTRAKPPSSRYAVSGGALAPSPRRSPTWTVSSRACCRPPPQRH